MTSRPPFRRGMLFLLSVVAGATFSGSAQGQVVRWSNPAGGAFEVGANWDTGHAPGLGDMAVFDLSGAYTVSLSAAATVGQLSIDEGSPTLDLGGGQLSVDPFSGRIDIGSAWADASLRLASGTLGVGDLTNIGAAPGSTGTLTVEAGSSVTIGNGEFNIGGPGVGRLIIRGAVTDAGVDKNKSLYAGSLIRIEAGGGLLLRHFHNLGGRVEIDGGSMGAASWDSPGGGEIVASGGAMLGAQDSFSCAGTFSLTGGATLTAHTGPNFLGGAVTIDGTGSRVTGGDFSGVSPSINIANGGALSAFNLDLTAPTISVGAGGSITVQSDFFLRGGVLHVSAGAELSLAHLVMTNSPTLEVELDGAALPTSPVIVCGYGPFFPVLAGAVRPIIRHPNNLHAGDQVELVQQHSFVPLDTTFANLQAQPLGGGRQLRLSYTGQSVFLRVVAGGPGCWTMDFNGDGDIGTDADIEDFFACVAGNCCPTCAPADFDGDGQTATDADIVAFFAALAGGSC